MYLGTPSHTQGSTIKWCWLKYALTELGHNGTVQLYYIQLLYILYTATIYTIYSYILFTVIYYIQLHIYYIQLRMYYNYTAIILYTAIYYIQLHTNIQLYTFTAYSMYIQQRGSLRLGACALVRKYKNGYYNAVLTTSKRV